MKGIKIGDAARKNNNMIPQEFQSISFDMPRIIISTSQSKDAQAEERLRILMMDPVEMINNQMSVMESIIDSLKYDGNEIMDLIKTQRKEKKFNYKETLMMLKEVQLGMLNDHHGMLGMSILTLIFPYLYYSLGSLFEKQTFLAQKDLKEFGDKDSVKKYKEGIREKLTHNFEEYKETNWEFLN